MAGDMPKGPGQARLRGAAVYLNIASLLALTIWFPPDELVGLRQRLLWGFGAVLVFSPIVFIVGASGRFDRTMANASIGIVIIAVFALVQDGFRAQVGINPAPPLTSLHVVILATMLLLSLPGTAVWHRRGHDVP